TWTPTGSMSVARSQHTSTLLFNGLVLVTGGLDVNNQPTDSAEIYNSNTGIWSVTGSMTDKRMGHTATLLSSGDVLVAGGNSTAQNSAAEIYFALGGTWSATGSLITRRSNHSASLLRSGKVLVAGGIGPQGPSLRNAELWDPLTGIWSNTGKMHDG